MGPPKPGRTLSRVRVCGWGDVQPLAADGSGRAWGKGVLESAEQAWGIWGALGPVERQEQLEEELTVKPFSPWMCWQGLAVKD